MVVSEGARQGQRLNAWAGEEFLVVASEVVGQTANSIDLGEISGKIYPMAVRTVFELPKIRHPNRSRGPLAGIFLWSKRSTPDERRRSTTHASALISSSAEKAVDDVYKAANNLEDAIGAGAI